MLSVVRAAPPLACLHAWQKGCQSGGAAASHFTPVFPLLPCRFCWCVNMVLAFIAVRNE